MTRRDNLLERLEQVNPVPDPSRLYQDTETARHFYLSDEQRREKTMTDTKIDQLTPGPRGPRVRRGLAIGTAAAALVIIVGVVAFAFAAGDGTDVAAPEFPTGRFESTARAFEFNEDGTFGFFTSPSSTVPAVEGTYFVDGDLYTELTADYAPCPFPGTYAWTYDGQNLTFQLVGEDACGVRVAAYDGRTYTRSQ